MFDKKEINLYLCFNFQCCDTILKGKQIQPRNRRLAAIMMTFPIRRGQLQIYDYNHAIPDQIWSIANFMATIMTFPVRHGQIES